MKKTFRSIIALTLSLLMVFGYAGAGIIGFAGEPCADNAHKWELVDEEEPTEDTCGFKKYECSECGTTDTITVHSDSGRINYTVTKKASCKEAGECKYTCTICNMEVTEDIPTLPHNLYVSNIVRPTCTDDGYSEFACRDCGYTEGKISTNPDGSILTQDVMIGGQQVEVPVDRSVPIGALGHDEDGAFTEMPASCETVGVRVNTCSRCGFPATHILPALDHDYGDWVRTTAPTCCEEGVAVRRCERTNIKVDDQGKPVMREDNPEEYVYEVCGHEEYKTLPKDPAEHDWDEGLIIQTGNCTTDQIKLYTCKGVKENGDPCGATKKETDPHKGHKYSSLNYDANSVLYSEVCTECHDIIAYYPYISVEFTNCEIGEDGTVYIMNGQNVSYQVCLRDSLSGDIIKVDEMIHASVNDTNVISFNNRTKTNVTGKLTANSMGTATISLEVEGKEEINCEIDVVVTGKEPIKVTLISDAQKWQPAEDDVSFGEYDDDNNEETDPKSNYSVTKYDYDKDGKQDTVITILNQTEGDTILLPSHEMNMKYNKTSKEWEEDGSLTGYEFRGWKIISKETGEDEETGEEKIDVDTDGYLTIPSSDIVLKAVVEPIKYTATFYTEKGSNGKVCGQVKYTVEDDTLVGKPLPAVPQKVGYIGSWNKTQLATLTYSNDDGNPTRIYPEYEKDVYGLARGLKIAAKPAASYENYDLINPGTPVSITRVDYGTGIKLNAVTGYYTNDYQILLPDGMQIAWFVGAECVGLGNSVTLEYIKEETKVQIAYVSASFEDYKDVSITDRLNYEDDDGVTHYYQDYELIRVNDNILKKIIGTILMFLRISLTKEQPSRGMDSYRSLGL